MPLGSIAVNPGRLASKFTLSRRIGLSAMASRGYAQARLKSASQAARGSWHE
jgi:hypothetical protein